jgi:predicted XRE-type DNA-binding protein
MTTKKLKPKRTSVKKLNEYIKEAEKFAVKGELPKLTDKAKLSTEDIFKISLCKLFVQFMNQNKIKPTQLHELTGIEKTRISEIINYKVTKFKIDQLIKNLGVLAKFSPEIKEHLIYLESMIAMPLKKVAETKKITNSMVGLAQINQVKSI